jgi:hypothetical protein
MDADGLCDEYISVSAFMMEAHNVGVSVDAVRMSFAVAINAVMHA